MGTAMLSLFVEMGSWNSLPELASSHDTLDLQVTEITGMHQYVWQSFLFLFFLSFFFLIILVFQLRALYLPGKCYN
jgi:hypothetical protein